MLSVKDLRREEAWAQEVIGRVLSRRVEQHDDGSRPGMHDLTVLRPGKRAAAVEVVAAADSESIELWRLINDDDERWQVDGLQGGWAVSVDPSARAKRLRRELPALLGQLEKVDMRELRPGRERGRPFSDVARDLMVTSAWRGGTDFPGSIYVTVERAPQLSGGVVASNGNALASWIGNFLREHSQRDVLAKLARSETDERHAFVILPGFTTAPFVVSDLLMREDAPIPTDEPELPSAVTNVWLASTWSTGRGFCWAPDDGWCPFDKWSYAEA
jgi:hypothetical protein